MKLKNRKTGEIAIFRSIPKWNDKSITLLVEDTKKVYQYDTFADLCEEWEDAPKEWWLIDTDGFISRVTSYDEKIQMHRDCKEIGNYFETKEEAEEAVRKLKAWKRLKDKGFRFCGWSCTTKQISFDTAWLDYWETIGKVTEDLNLLFNQEDKE